MNLNKKIKNKANSKIKKLAFKAIKPFLPFIIIIVFLFFAICTIIDAVFIDNVQSDNTYMSETEIYIKNKCIEKSEYLNTCHNYKNGELTKYLLDVDDREKNKEIQWSHLYSIMSFHNLTDDKEINESLLNKVAENFESTFKYEKDIIEIETITKDNEGNETTSIEEKTQYILIESDSIIGHYKYNYEKITIEKDNVKTTKKVFMNEELIGEKYERLKKYLKEKLHINESEMETDLEIIIQAANGYYEGKENTSWLQGEPSSNTILEDGENYIPKGMFIWPIPGYTKITSPFGMRTHPITGAYKLHSGTDISAPVRSKFCCNGRWNYNKC